MESPVSYPRKNESPDGPQTFPTAKAGAARLVVSRETKDEAERERLRASVENLVNVVKREYRAAGLAR